MLLLVTSLCGYGELFSQDTIAITDSAAQPTFVSTVATCDCDFSGSTREYVKTTGIVSWEYVRLESHLESNHFGLFRRLQIEHLMRKSMRLNSRAGRFGDYDSRWCIKRIRKAKQTICKAKALAHYTY